MKKFFIIAGIIVLAAVVLNYTLGGFTKVEPGLISVNASTIYGRIYEGRHNSQALDELIDSLNNELTSNNPTGHLAIVNYMQPELEKRGIVRQFVGIIYDDPETHPSGTFDSLNILAYNGIQFNVPIKPLVMPSPEKFKHLALDMAKEMEAELAGFSIEQYDNQMLIINFPLK